MIEIRNEYTGRYFEFSSQEALDAAEDWYNATSKAEIIAWCAANGVEISASETTLVEDWADRAMAAWAARKTH